MKNRFVEAIEVQDACNPSGVCLSFIRAVDAAISDVGGDGPIVLTDPALALFGHKIADLMGVHGERSSMIATNGESLKLAAQAIVDRQREMYDAGRGTDDVRSDAAVRESARVILCSTRAHEANESFNVYHELTEECESRGLARARSLSP